MLDNRDGKYNQLSIAQIQLICDRRFGVGADGLICINKHENYAFEVDYSNSDGSKSFCGNGARCSVAFAAFLGINCESVTFLAIDGEHQGDGGRNHSSGSIASEVIAGISERKRDAIRAYQDLKMADKANTIGQRNTSEKNHDHDGRDGGSERNNNGLGSLGDDTRNLPQNNGRPRDDKSHQSHENRRTSTATQEEIRPKSPDIEM